MKQTTQSVYRNIIERFCEETSTAGVKYGDMPAAGLMQRHVIRLMAARVDKPDSANGLRKALRAMFDHAIGEGIRADNPTRGVKALRPKSIEGYHRWTDDEVSQFEIRHAIATKARLAMALGLFLGQARQDVIAMGPQHIKNGVLHWIRKKTENKTALPLFIPIHPHLQEILDATSVGNLNFLVTEFGKPFTPAGFGNWFRDKCNDAGLSRRCSFHGLRKASASRLADVGCSAHEIAAITGHATLKEIVRYTATADRKKLAASAMEKLKTRTSVG